jgi:hypothetical protein
MSAVSFQSIKLSKGKHSSPEEGACVMELASMLSEEEFSDRPASVCPVIAAFMRAYNDIVDGDGQRDLYVCAAKVIGSRASARVRIARAERLAEWAGQAPRRGWTRFFLPPHRITYGLSGSDLDALGERAAQAICKQGGHADRGIVSLVDELLAVKDSRARRAESASTRAPDVLHLTR